MSDGAEELPPVVAALTGDDESFLAMLERDTAALAQFREDMLAALAGTGGNATVGSLGVGDAAAAEADQAQEAADAAMESVAEATAQVRDELALTADEADATAESVARSAQESAQALSAAFGESAESISRQAARVGSEIGALQDQIKALIAQNTAETDAEAQALMARVSEMNQQLVALNEASFGAGADDAVAKLAQDAGAASTGLQDTKFELESMRGELDQLYESAAGLQAAMVGSFKDIESGALSAEQAIEKLEAAITAARTITAAQGEAILGAAPANPGVSLGGLAAAAVTYQDAAAAAEKYGTAEAQAAAATRLLANADAALADQNALLMQSYLMAANGAKSGAEISTEAYRALQAQLGAVADAEGGVAAALSAQIDALNAVNLAVIRNNSELATDTVALAGLQAASEATGIATDELAMKLENGEYKALGKAAAEAEATLKSVALADAEQRLAATQMTLLTAMSEVAAGADMDAAQLGLLRASVASTEAEVVALRSGTEGAAGGMGRMGSGSMMAQMALWSLASYIPQAISGMESLTGVGDHTAVSVQGIESAMLGMSATVSGSNDSIGQLTQGLGMLSNGFGHAVAGLGDIDQALVALQQTDPELAAQQAAKVEAALEATGMSSADAQQALSGYNQAVQQTAISLAAQQHAIEDTVPGTQAYSDAVQQATMQLEQQQLQSQETADAQQQWLNTVLPGTQEWTRAVQSSTTALEFQGQQSAISADAQRAYLAELVPGTQQYTYALDAAQTALLSSASSARINAEALNSLLPAQAQIGDSAIRDAQAYSEVQQAASEYGNALTALYGIYGNTSAAEAAFTTELANAVGTIHSGKDAVDQYTKSGAANITTFAQMAQSAQTTAMDIYEQTGSTDQANESLRTMAGEIDALATKSHFTSGQVQQLNEELWGVKDVGQINIPINADTTTAKQELTNLLHAIDTSIGTIRVQLLDGGSEYGTIKGPIAAKAGGGAVNAGETYLIGENGPELMQFGGSGFITPNDRIHPSALGGGAVAAGGAASAGPTVIINFPQGFMVGDEMFFADLVQQAMGRLGLNIPDQYASVQTTRGRR